MPQCTCSQGKMSGADIAEIAGLFKALGHPVRLSMVEQLRDGEKCVCELHAESGRDMSTVSSHLNILRQCGVVESEQRGRYIYYRLAKPCISQMISCLAHKA